MPIISKETWDNMPKEEKEKICIDYHNYNVLLDAKSMAVLENTFGKENLQPQLTYEDVARELFGTGIDEKGHFTTIPCIGMRWDNKLQAIGRLLAVAKFLNKYWKPNWNYVQDKWYLAVEDGQIKVDYHDDIHNSHIVYFPTKELAQQAVAILGENTVRLALSSDF